MSKEQDAIIAEWCEPKPIYVHTFDESFLRHNPPKSPNGFWRCVCIYDHGDIPEWVPISFSTDLNAMALAEKMMEERGLEDDYAIALADIVMDDYVKRIKDGLAKTGIGSWTFEIATATAAQRAEALVRMIEQEGVR